jgi:hypothetical protein
MGVLAFLSFVLPRQFNAHPAEFFFRFFTFAVFLYRTIFFYPALNKIPAQAGI